MQVQPIKAWRKKLCNDILHKRIERYVDDLVIKSKSRNDLRIVFNWLQYAILRWTHLSVTTKNHFSRQPKTSRHPDKTTEKLSQQPGQLSSSSTRKTFPGVFPWAARKKGHSRRSLAAGRICFSRHLHVHGQWLFRRYPEAASKGPKVGRRNCGYSRWVIDVLLGEALKPYSW